MAKNNKKKTDTAKPASKGLAISATLKPFLILLLAALLMTAAIIATVQQMAVPDIEKKASDIHLETMAESTSSLLNIRFTYTSRQLEALAQDELLKQTIASGDMAATEKLAALLQKNFNDSDSLAIIPWDYTATVGLKERGIEMRNNIETMMLTRAGGNRVPDPEVYQHDKQWLISFAQPVTIDNEVRGIIFLSFNQRFFSTVINNAFYRENAAITITHKGQKQPLATNGVNSNNAAATYPLPFTDGELHIASAHDISRISHQATGITYASIGSCTLFLAVLLLLLYFSLRKSLKKDIDLISHFAESLAGLHRTMPPKLQHPELNKLVESLPDICSKGRSAVTPPDQQAPRMEKAATSNIPPAAGLATPDVVEEDAIDERVPFAAPHIFRDYDIRGHANNDLNDGNAELIGKAIGSEARSLNIDTLLVGRDGRLSGNRIFTALVKGITASGCHVINIGQVPTPLLYFAAHQSDSKSGIMITASHNPAEDNGLKIMLDGKTLQGPLIQRLLKRIENHEFTEDSPGSISEQDFSAAYQQAVTNDILIAKPLKIVIDGANGTGGELAQQLFTRLNCEVVPLFCDVDGNFPNHAPDPSVASNLSALTSAIIHHQADIGIAFDGDADRMVAVTSLGQIVDGDKLLMIFAEDIVSRNPAATVVYDIKCSSHIRDLIQQYGGKPLMWKTGHANIKTKMQETGALLGGEFTGHYFFKERWFGFDDGIYAALRLIELLTNDNQTLDQRLGQLPSSSSTSDLHIMVANDKAKFNIIRQLQAAMSSEPGEINKLDGIRIDYEKGWGLVRASNTRAALTARFEANTADEMNHIQSIFRDALTAIDGSLSIPF